MYLLSKKKATADEIASKFEISVRTVYRYVNALTLANIPIRTNTGREGGIWIDSEFKLTSNFFSQKERQLIADSLNMFKNDENTAEVDVVLQKLHSVK